MHPTIPCRCIDFGIFGSCEFGAGALHSSSSQLSFDAEHLGDVIATMDGLATAPTSHLVVRLGSYAPLVHIRDLLDGERAERHVGLSV